MKAKIRSFHVLVAAALILMLVPAPMAFAGDTKPITVNQTFHNATQTILSEGACGAGTAEVTLTYNGQIHMTIMPDGEYLLKVSQEGIWVGPSASGHYTVLILDNFIATGETHQYVFSSNGNGTGQRWHIVAHATVNADGTATVDFEKLVCF